MAAVVLACFGPRAASDGWRFELVNGSASSSGVLVAHVPGMPKNVSGGHICSSGLSQTGARLVCRLLGFSSSNVVTFRPATVGEERASGHSTALLSFSCADVTSTPGNCSFTETQTIAASSGGAESCAAAYLDCDSPASDVPVFSIDPETLTLLADSTNGTVCSSGFDSRAAELICESIHPGASSNRRPFFWVRGTTFRFVGVPVAIDDVRCDSGGSGTLAESCHFRHGGNRCAAGDIIALSCGPDELIPFSVTPFNSPVRIALAPLSTAPPSALSGQYWYTLFGAAMDNSSVPVLCEMAGFNVSGGGSQLLVPAQSTWSQGTPIYFDNVSGCPAAAAQHIQQCDHYRIASSPGTNAGMTIPFGAMGNEVHCDGVPRSDWQWRIDNETDILWAKPPGSMTKFGQVFHRSMSALDGDMNLAELVCAALGRGVPQFVATGRQTADLSITRHGCPRSAQSPDECALSSTLSTMPRLLGDRGYFRVLRMRCTGNNAQQPSTQPWVTFASSIPAPTTTSLSAAPTAAPSSSSPPATSAASPPPPPISTTTTPTTTTSNNNSSSAAAAAESSDAEKYVMFSLALVLATLVVVLGYMACRKRSWWRKGGADDGEADMELGAAIMMQDATNATANLAMMANLQQQQQQQQQQQALSSNNQHFVPHPAAASSPVAASATSVGALETERSTVLPVPSVAMVATTTTTTTAGERTTKVEQPLMTLGDL